ncbi:hypothetical protein JCM14036_31270 [Desulfotomaculum defluvii]
MSLCYKQQVIINREGEYKHEEKKNLVKAYVNTNNPLFYFEYHCVINYTKLGSGQ